MNQSTLVTPEDVLSLTKPTDKFLCTVDDNVYDIEFLGFKMRDCYDNSVLYEINKPVQQIGIPLPEEQRQARFHFGPQFFNLKTIGTTLKFRVGQKEVADFTVVERHYFKNKLLKSYHFTAPFCMANSENEMESIYDLPEYTPEQKQEMINSPWQTASDSFYFAGGRLVMHTKALYSYAVSDQ